MSDSDAPPASALLDWIELAELLRVTEVQLLEALALLRGVEPEISASSAVTVSAEDAAGVLSSCHAILDFSDELRALSENMRAVQLDVRSPDLEVQAGAALALGVADIRRVEVLARCLSTDAGFPALAKMLRYTDFHDAWRNTTIGHVLSSFRGSDAHLIRRVTEQALLSPQACWDACAPDQIARLADVLEQHGTDGTMPTSGSVR